MKFAILFLWFATQWAYCTDDTASQLRDADKVIGQLQAQLEGIQRHDKALVEKLDATTEANNALAGHLKTSDTVTVSLIDHTLTAKSEAGAAAVATVKVQGKLDAATATIAQLEKDKAKLMRLLFVIAALAAAASLHFIPVTLGLWRYAIAAGVGLAAYALLYAIL